MTTTNGEYKAVLTEAQNGDRVVLLVDISELLAQQRELTLYAEKLEHSNQEFSHQALHDELTGLGNRRFLNLKIEELTEHRRQFGGEIAALHVDLDRFKQVNDTMGHAAGDFVLEQVSRCLNEAARDVDIVTRTGGDEFVMLLPCDADSHIPEQTAARLVEEIGKPVYFEGRRCNFGTSVGVARTPLIQPDELLTSSDIALYKAKTAGRGCVGVFDEEDLQELHSTRNLVDQIGVGLEQGQFLPLFQPEVECQTGRIVALEVLARWEHPDRGLLEPCDFIEAADEAQLLARIDAAIFVAAMAEVQRLAGAFAVWPRLSFNVSRSRLHDVRVLEDLKGANYPGELTFELAEATMMDDGSVEYHRNLEGLRQAGVELCVDEFGSGSASILALRRLSPNRIKLDRRLIEPIVQSSSARQLVDSIARTARTLEIGISAAGVETAEQALMLKQLGCDRLQGILFAEPMPIETAISCLNSKAPLRSAGADLRS